MSARHEKHPLERTRHSDERSRQELSPLAVLKVPCFAKDWNFTGIRGRKKTKSGRLAQVAEASTPQQNPDITAKEAQDILRDRYIANRNAGGRSEFFATV